MKLVFFCLVIAIAVMQCSAFRNGPSSTCENKSEFNDCKNRCYSDRDCNDEANLNCSMKCKQACQRIEKIGRCRGALLETILRVRGRLDRGRRRGGSRDSDRGRNRNRGPSIGDVENFRERDKDRVMIRNLNEAGGESNMG